jgi:hypothetical protein
MESEIRIPPPDEIKARIERRRAEIRHLKRILQLSWAGKAAQNLSATNESTEGGDDAAR